MKSPVECTTTAVDLRLAMRKLWEDHITWTRLYIVSDVADLADKDATAQRLLQNQVDIGNAVKPYYGDAAGDQLTALLKNHILGLVEVVGAAKTGDKAKLAAANARWYAHADEIAAFLSRANPQFWPLATMKGMMKQHLDLTEAEAVAHLQKRYQDEVAAYEKVHLHILGLADALTPGTVGQFPDRRTSPSRRFQLPHLQRAAPYRERNRSHAHALHLREGSSDSFSKAGARPRANPPDTAPV